MHTKIEDQFKQNPDTVIADSILKKCVHCGFCNATCPTYQITADERDSPRGRIYLIKKILEGDKVTRSTQTHFDRCLICRSCETTCPSGVEYHHLLEIGKSYTESQLYRPWKQRAIRYLLMKLVPKAGKLKPFMPYLMHFSWLLPAKYRVKLPHDTIQQQFTPKPDITSPQMLVLEGCVQSILGGQIHYQTLSILQQLGISAISVGGCCGAITHHLNNQVETIDILKALIDQCWPYLESGTQTIVSTASGCGMMLSEIEVILTKAPDYHDKAKVFKDRLKDISEVINQLDIDRIKPVTQEPVVFQAPCSLQHGLNLDTLLENLLVRLGFNLLPVKDAHLCCGSAGTYSILQPVLSQKLQEQKALHLEANNPAFILTANIGCQLHLNEVSTVPVKHWIELIEVN